MANPDKHVYQYILTMKKFDDDSIIEMIMTTKPNLQISDVNKKLIDYYNDQIICTHKKICDDFINYLGLDFFLDLPGSIKTPLQQMNNVTQKLQNNDYKNIIISIIIDKIKHKKACNLM